MSSPVYLWRKLTEEQRTHLLAWRRNRGLPWHRPPHRAGSTTRYHITAACFEHRRIIGRDGARMDHFCRTLLATMSQHGTRIHAWCVLPNHYHALVETPEILAVLSELARMHGRLSFRWNGEENKRGRQVWCGVAERFMRNDAHYWATVNYIHHNPVHHGYTDQWQAWQYSSARTYLDGIGHAAAARIWREFPILDYGKGWDDPDL